MSETRTSWNDRREFEERLAGGETLSVTEIDDLIADADSGERSTGMLEGLERVLKKELGISIVDLSTDDEDGRIILELVRDDEPKDSIGE